MVISLILFPILVACAVALYMVRVKKNAIICQICAPQSDKTTFHTFMVCLWICAGSAEYGNAALFAKCAAFSRGVRFLCRKKAPQSLYKTAHFARKTPHFHGLRRASEKRCRTFEKDGALTRKMAHYWDCGELSKIAAQPSKCGAQGRRKPFFKCRHSMFIAFLFTCTVHTSVCMHV